ncbi:hypothetical protein HG537_0A07360 [Torulaspora globosa]|uniref:Uncharacterized protein n=1 Tax=Torulaspora globosa TaxID=48254 RepID=A0A7H9HMH2_9SACH|nr:hypothetical protein HG537_0A07360 [Torulaspora sp. CBS 2947]
MTIGERRPSLLFDNYEEVHYKSANSSLKETIEKNRLKIPYKPEELSIDDLDMMPLSTSFDKQMLLGSPMYLDPEEQEEKHSMIMEDYAKHGSHSSQPIPTDCSTLYLSDDIDGEKSFEALTEIRAKYILASTQDSASNIKYDLDKMFLYPKPLPKFWKFDKDKRLNENQPDSSDDEQIDGQVKPGYYFPSPTEDQYVRQEELGVPKRLGRVHYTGEFFELDHFKKEFETHKRKYRLRVATVDYSNIPKFQEFRKDFLSLAEIARCSPLSEVAQKRIKYLVNKFDLFQHLNCKAEILENKRVPLRDFYNSRKVDRDFLLSGCATQRQLSEFIWEKLNVEPHRVVHKTFKGEKLTLAQVFEYGSGSGDPMAIGLKVIDDEFLEWYRNVYLITSHLIPSADAEKVLNGKELRFYLLAKIFLEFDNYLDGEYLAEIFILYCVHTLEKSKYQLAQISVDFQFYHPNEGCWWEKFSRWIIKWKLVSHNIRWNVRLSRVFTKLFRLDRIGNFQDYLDLIFDPLFENEGSNNIALDFFLMNVGCIDLVVSSTDDYLWQDFTDINAPPREWSAKGDNPTISYYMYYIYAQLARLNCLRHNKNLNTISLRNDCSTLLNRTSQAGSDLNFTDQLESLICNFMLCDAGLLQAEAMCENTPLMTYLFYLCQIPVIVAPLSSVSSVASQTSQEEVLAILGDTQKSTRDITKEEQSTYTTNPFMNMFKMGMKVSLSSKSVLFNSSYTMEPMIEEYSVAASIYLLNAADLCELSRTSVLCSSYEGFYKAHWIGVGVRRTPFQVDNVGYVNEWYDREVDTSARHNVPNIRRNYRRETWNQEWAFIREQFGLNN